MKTKAQKIKQVEEGTVAIKKSETLIFADFTGATVSELGKLKKALRETGAKFTVYKKRLLGLMFKNLNIDFDVKKFEGQVGTVLSPKHIADVAGPVYKFSREVIGTDKKERFQILGGFDLTGKRFLEAQEVKMIGQLPPREVLLGQLLGAVSGPLKMFLNILDQKSKVEVNKN